MPVGHFIKEGAPGRVWIGRGGNGIALRVREVDGNGNIRQACRSQAIGDGHRGIESLPLEGQLLANLQLTSRAKCTGGPKRHRQKEKKNYS